MSRGEQRRSIIKATIAVAASRALGFPLALAVNMVLARILTREEFAFFGVLASFSLLFALFAQAGYQTSVVRLMGEAEAGDETLDRPSIFYSSILATFVFGCILAVLFFWVGRGFLPMVEGEGRWLFLLAAVLLVVRSLNTVSSQALRGLGKVGASANLSGHGDQGGVVRCISMLAGFGVAIALGVLTLEVAIWISIGASLLCTLWAAVLVLRQTGTRFSGKDVRRTLNTRKEDNFNMMLGEALFYWVTASGAIVIGGAIVDAAAMAGMVAAFQLRNILTSPMTMIAGAVPNILIRLQREGDTKELEKVLRMTASAAFIVCAGACLFLLAIGPAGLKLIFGPDYGDAYYHLAIISPGILYYIYCGLAGQTLLWLGSTRVHRRVMLGVVALTTPAYFLLAHFFGAYGLSAGLVLSILLQNTLMMRAVKRSLGVTTQAYLNPRKYWEAMGMAKDMLAERRRAKSGDL